MEHPLCAGVTPHLVPGRPTPVLPRRHLVFFCRCGNAGAEGLVRFPICRKGMGWESPIPLQGAHFSEDNLKSKGHQLSGQKEMMGLVWFEFLLIFQLPEAVSLLLVR